MAPIYTKTGDSGRTSLFGGGRVDKDDLRVDAYGEVDELNAAIGAARSQGLPADLDALAGAVQEQLFTLGSVLATPAGSKAQSAIPKLQPQWALRMEEAIDAWTSELPALQHFILPGGTAAASALHMARTVCRRAERKVVSLDKEISQPGEVLIYLNRLSDLLFVMARMANFRAGTQDVLWIAPRP